MEKKPSLEITKALIQEKIDRKIYLLEQYPETGNLARTALRNDIKRQLSDLEQGLKAVNNHYALIEALKTVVNYSIEDLEEWSAGTDSLIISLTPFDILKVLEAIKNCER